MRYGRTERVKAELRQLVLTLSMVVGLVPALRWALAHEAPSASCEGDPVVCWDGLYEQLVPTVARLAAGIGLGLAFGVALCLAVPGLRRRR